MASGLLSDDCDRFRAFWADPRMPSRLKLGVRAALSELGDLSELGPLEPPVSWGEGISTEKSRFGSGNCRTMVALAEVVMVAVAECGESPLDDGDMLAATRVSVSSLFPPAMFRCLAVSLSLLVSFLSFFLLVPPTNKRPQFTCLELGADLTVLLRFPS